MTDQQEAYARHTSSQRRVVINVQRAALLIFTAFSGVALLPLLPDAQHYGAGGAVWCLLSLLALGWSSPASHSPPFCWYAYHLDDNNTLVRTGVKFNVYDSNGATLSVHSRSSAIGGASSSYSTWLVSDGGTTLSSQFDPTLNINNPSAPINAVPVFAIGGLALMGLVAGRRRRTENGFSGGSIR